MDVQDSQVILDPSWFGLVGLDTFVNGQIGPSKIPQAYRSFLCPV